MLQKIEQLRLASTGLEPSAAERKELLEQTTTYAELFLHELQEMKTYVAGDSHSKSLQQPFSENPGVYADLITLLDQAVDNEGINAASGGHMGYIPGGGMYPSALGDFLADIFNRYAGISFASPGAVKMEQQLVRWMADLVGYPATAGGDLTSGGSIANLSAIITARETKRVRARDVDTSCVYVTADANHCIDKSLRAAGLADCPKRLVSMDKNFRMDVAALERAILDDKAAGLRPWLIMASAGTTDTGAVDPIDRISELAEQHDIWLHVDAAYGGFFLLCEEGRQVLQGLDKAHSIVLDPHKGMFLPYGSGAVLVRDVTWLARSQSYVADYMQDAVSGENEYSPADLSLELTRPFRGLRFWLPLKLFGVAPFRAALAEKIWLARYFHAQLDATPAWEVGPFPELSVVTFRYVPDNGDADALNERLVEAVHQDGQVFISSTRINDIFVLRLAVLHFRTHLQQVNYVLEFLQQKAIEFS
jgi:glutamate/tyrosine decarboxylase-like PLP-dependent enzyme